MQFLETYLNRFQTHLSEHAFQGLPHSLYEPCNYIMSLGGKRVRPSLVIMACDLYSDEMNRAMPLALSIEIFHNFTLMHDDIMDRSPIRRGLATVHEKYDENTAILSGDAMLIKAYSLLHLSPPQVFPAIFETFNVMAKELCEGQRLDMDFETNTQVSISEYIHMIELKTAVLLGAALKIGALAGNAPQEDAEHLFEFGRNIGIAFQIQDDLLDTFGGADVGKKIGGDIRQNKKTYLFLKALELAGEEVKQELLNIYSGQTLMSEEEKVERVTSIFKSLLVEEYANQVKDAYKDLAMSHLVSLHIPAEKKNVLQMFAEYLIGREK